MVMNDTSTDQAKPQPIPSRVLANPRRSRR